MPTSARTPHHRTPPGASVCTPHHHILYFVGVSAHRYAFAPVHWTTTPGTAGTMWASSPTNMDELPRVVCGAGTSSGTVRHKAAVHHPRWGGDGGLRLRRGLRHLRMALWTIGVFRWLRPAGISRRARRGCFARCDGRPGLCPWTPRFFEKNRVKLLSFYSRIVTCIWFAASCQGTLCPAPWLQKMESAGFSVSRSRSYPEAAATASPSGQTS